MHLPLRYCIRYILINIELGAQKMDQENPIFNNLFIADVASVWENVSNFIEKHMSQQKVNI